MMMRRVGGSPVADSEKRVLRSRPLPVTWHGPHCAAAPSAAMARDPSSLRAGQHALSGAAFLVLIPAGSAVLLLALRFVFARGLLSPLVTLLTYWAGALG